jgi:DNA-binding MarR family transcriptional regulator
MLSIKMDAADAFGAILKTHTLDAGSRKAADFLNLVAGDEEEHRRTSGFPPESYFHDLGQIEILSTLLKQLYEQTIQARTGVSLIEWRALEAIGHAPGITATELAAYWEYDKVSVGRAIQSLKKRGFLVASPHPDDKRKTELRHTTAGQIAFDEHLQMKKRTLDALALIVTTEELDTFNAISHKLVEHFRRVIQVAKQGRGR